MSISSIDGRASTADSTSENGSFYSRRSSSRNSTTYSVCSTIVDSNHIHISLLKRDSVASDGSFPLGEVRVLEDSSSEAVTPKPPDESTEAEKLEQEKVRLDAERKATEAAIAATALWHKNLYIGQSVFKINDFVFCGGSDEAYNNSLLCRLDITFLIDVNASDKLDAIRMRTEVPCACGQVIPHSRTTLQIRLPDDSYDMMLPPRTAHHRRFQGRDATVALVQPTKSVVGIDDETDVNVYFEEAVACIERAKQAKKCVLIHSARCRNRAPAFAAAYLMYSENLTRLQAVAKVQQCFKDITMSKRRPGIAISDGFQRALGRWQTFCAKKRANPKVNDDIDKLFQVRVKMN
uniref:protein-tyrosine-phosphatase n=1 Tax=Panagrellus redivivus TaxID=6233 RepID=A0A7E4ZRK8_PANRE